MTPRHLGDAMRELAETGYVDGVTQEQATALVEAVQDTGWPGMVVVYSATYLWPPKTVYSVEFIPDGR